MTGWEPATEVEAALRDALRANDQELYFRILARTDLLLPVASQAPAGRSLAGWGTWSTGGRTHVLAFTSEAALRACLAENAGATRRTPYAELAGNWPNLEWWLAVNPGLPIEGYLPAWFVAQLVRGDVRLPGRTLGARARLEHVESARARATAAVPRQTATPGTEPQRQVPPAGPVPPGAPAPQADQPPTPRPPVPASVSAPPSASVSAPPWAPVSAPPSASVSAPPWAPVPAPPSAPVAAPSPAPPPVVIPGLPRNQPSARPPREAPPPFTPGGAPAGPPPAFPSDGRRNDPPPPFTPTSPAPVKPAASVPQPAPAGPAPFAPTSPAPFTPTSPAPFRPAAPEPFARTRPETYTPARPPAPAPARPPAPVPADPAPVTAPISGGPAPHSPVPTSGGPDPHSPGLGAASGAGPASPAPVTADFVPANEVEQNLLDAAADGSTDAFLSTLLLANVLVPVPATSTPGARPGEEAFSWYTERIDGETYLVVFTSPDRMAEHIPTPMPTVLVKFARLIRHWPDKDWSFAVNPGTPVGAKLPGAQIIALASWVAEVGLGEDESAESTLVTASEEPAPRPTYTPARVDPGRPTVMQKVIAPSQIGYYLERGYDRASGFVHRQTEVAHLNTPAKLYAALGLNYPGSPFTADSTEIYVLRWPAYRPSLYRIPYGGQNEAAMRAMEGWVIERPPFRGNGFAPGESSDVVAEFKVDSVRLPQGAQLSRVGADGTERMIATLDCDVPTWKRVEEE